MAFLEIGANSASDEYEISNSVRFNTGDSPKLQTTTGSTGSSNRKFTLSVYIKVDSADFKDGILNIKLFEEIPEEKKAKTIKIK